MLMLNSILRVCIMLAVHACSRFVNTKISMLWLIGHFDKVNGSQDSTSCPLVLGAWFHLGSCFFQFESAALVSRVLPGHVVQERPDPAPDHSPSRLQVRGRGSNPGLAKFFSGLQ